MALVARRVSSKASETPLGLEAGRLIYVEYEDEVGFFHARLILMKTSAGMMMKVTGESCRNPDAVFWVLTPDGDIYPEEIGVAPLTGVVSCSDDSRLDLRTMRPRGRRLRRAYEFVAGREAGTLSALTVARAIQAATTEEETAARRGIKPPEGVSFGHGDLPTADGGSVWTCCGPPGAARNGKKVEATDGAWTRLNELLLTTAGGATMVCSTAVYDGTEHGEEEEGGDINLDARVLSV